MKKIGILAAIAIGFVSLLSMKNDAHAQNIDVNCAALSGSQFMCIKNNSRYPVVAVQASTGMFSPAGWINVPGNSIYPGGTAIVRFNVFAGGCMQHVSIRTLDGQVHSYPFTDVCHYSSFTVNGW